MVVDPAGAGAGAAAAHVRPLLDLLAIDLVEQHLEDDHVRPLGRQPGGLERGADLVVDLARGVPAVVEHRPAGADHDHMQLAVGLAVQVEGQLAVPVLFHPAGVEVADLGHHTVDPLDVAGDDLPVRGHEVSHVKHGPLRTDGGGRKEKDAKGCSTHCRDLRAAVDHTRTRP
ncbi:MAG: hypothetical protein HYU66_24100 [Armatimonadetes bacterium]|nr:hypothetical protein [Armatimonadota bacterium]